ncbi:neuronal acetylcholine receptor subunit alpha-3-like [Lineus longissimus]|uniref:neuronal acetylcholine receptor subunit alpha-3-like n=1 Tax=Lineus longissimus TaxID=88925 RepID=UPI00315C688A
MQAQGSLNAEGKLIRQLTDPSVYEKAVRPVRNISDPVVVSIKLTVVDIQLDSSTETLTFFAHVGMEWNDAYMQWNESQYNGLRSIMVSAESVWLPDIGIFNRIDASSQFKYDESHRIILKSDGNATWVPGGIFAVKCKMKMTKFPFDKQECTIIIGSNAYSPRELQPVKGMRQMKFPDLAENGEWSLREEEEIAARDYGLWAWKEYHYRLYLRRNPTHHVLNILIPCVAISLLVLMVFCLPCESGEKISLGITTLVALTVFQMTTASNIPKNTSETPIIVIYLTALTGMSAASIVLTVLVLKVFYTPAEREMSQIVERIIRGLAKITCNTAANPRNLTSSSTTLSVSPMHRSREGVKDTDIITNRPQRYVKEDEPVTDHQTRLEWTVAARIIDKFLMYVFVISMFIITTVCFVMICS